MSAQWTRDDHAEAVAAGWDIFDTGGDPCPFQLQKRDDMGVFEDDGDAWDHVLDCERHGSDDGLSRRAMEFLREHSPAEYEKIRYHAEVAEQLYSV